jgi:NADH dehydrogenase
MQSRVTDVTRDGIVVSGPNGEERVACRTKVWAAGVQASPLGAMVADASGAKVDRSGRVEVLPDCSLPGHPEVFVIGDLMALNGLPGVAEVAMQSGMHAARTIRRRIGGDETQTPFRYRDLGSMATVARFRAIVSFKGIRVAGFVGWVMWAFVHLTFLTGFRNRFNAAMHWVGAFFGKARIQRTITVQQVAGRIIAMDAGLNPNEMEGPSEPSS